MTEQTIDYDFGRGVLYRIIWGTNAHSHRTYYLPCRVREGMELQLRVGAFLTLREAEDYMLLSMARHEPAVLHRLVLSRYTREEPNDAGN